MTTNIKGRPSALGVEQQAEALAMLARGKTHAQVARAMSSQGHKVSRQAISRLAKRTRVERAETTQAVAAERLGSSIDADLEEFDLQGKRLAELAGKLWEHCQNYPQECDTFLRVQRELRDHIATKFKMSGGAETAPPEWTGLGDLIGMVL